MSNSTETEDGTKNTAFEILSPKVRKIIYLTFAFVSAVVSALGAGIASAHGLFPNGVGLYIAFASAFLNAFGAAIGITALMNTPATTQTSVTSTTETPVVDAEELAAGLSGEVSK